MNTVTVAALIDYLSQFEGTQQVVLSMDDLPSDFPEELEDEVVSLTTAMDVLG